VEPLEELPESIGGEASGGESPIEGDEFVSETEETPLLESIDVPDADKEEDEIKIGEEDSIPDWLESTEIPDDEVGSEEAARRAEERKRMLEAIGINVDLADLRKEFATEEPEEEPEEEFEDEELGIIEGVVDDLMNRFQKTTQESPESKLRRLTFENLNKVSMMDNKRKATIGIAYVLKEFLEIRFNMPHELTYKELAEAIRSLDIRGSVKDELIRFFDGVRDMAYSPDETKQQQTIENFPQTYDMAQRAVSELTKRRLVP